jgi:hypothetical protein
MQSDQDLSRGKSSEIDNADELQRQLNIVNDAGKGSTEALSVRDALRAFDIKVRKLHAQARGEVVLRALPDVKRATRTLLGALFHSVADGMLSVETRVALLEYFERAHKPDGFLSTERSALRWIAHDKAQPVAVRVRVLSLLQKDDDSEILEAIWKLLSSGDREAEDAAARVLGLRAVSGHTPPDDMIGQLKAALTPERTVIARSLAEIGTPAALDALRLTAQATKDTDEAAGLLSAVGLRFDDDTIAQLLIRIGSRRTDPYIAAVVIAMLSSNLERLRTLREKYHDAYQMASLLISDRTQEVQQKAKFPDQRELHPDQLFEAIRDLNLKHKRGT